MKNQNSLQTHQKLTIVASDLYKFCKLTYGRKYIESPHMRDVVCPELQNIAKKKKGRLIVNLPPRHSKTDTISIRYSAWRIFHNPDIRILVATYGDELSEEIGVELRRIILEWGSYFNVYLSDHTKSKTKLKFRDRDGKEYKGTFQALSYKGAITGKGFDLVILDDLIKGPEDAISTAANRKVLDYYRSAIYTRLEEDSDVIVISTRWSKKDLTAHLIKNSKDKWVHIKLPAIDKSGNALWPIKFSLKRLYEIKSELGSFWFLAMYQQDPTTRDGGMFRREWFKIIKHAPNQLTGRVRVWDRGATSKTDDNDPDWTVGLLMAKDEHNNCYILDVKRMRGSSLENRKYIKQTAQLDGYSVDILYEEEGGSSGKDSSDSYSRLLAGYNFHTIRPSTDKALRADPFAAAAEAENVYVIDGPWVEEYLDEVEVFPDPAVHDDQVDTSSAGYKFLFEDGFGESADEEVYVY